MHYRDAMITEFNNNAEALGIDYVWAEDGGFTKPTSAGYDTDLTTVNDDGDMQTAQDVYYGWARIIIVGTTDTLDAATYTYDSYGAMYVAGPGDGYNGGTLGNYPYTTTEYDGWSDSLEYSE